MARRRTPEERRESSLSSTRALIRLCTYTDDDLRERIAQNATIAKSYDDLAVAFEVRRPFDVTAGAKRSTSRSINRYRWDAETYRQAATLFYEALKAREATK
jgi:hypothetical protein